MSEDERRVTIVSGLPRSGTSLMMQMLEAGGLDILTDNWRDADRSNPKGYYELERVKDLGRHETSWLEDARGKVVKVISALAMHLPPDYKYKILFMQRNPRERLWSERVMLAQRGQCVSPASDDELLTIYREHVQAVTRWMHAQSNVNVIYVNYGHMIVSPVREISRINRFLGGCLATRKMLDVVDPMLYRMRANYEDGEGIGVDSNTIH